MRKVTYRIGRHHAKARGSHMKQRINRAGACLLLLMLAMSPLPSQATEPLEFSAIENSINTLISERVVAEAYRRIGIQITTKQYPAARAIKLSANGSMDGELFRIGGLEKAYPNLVQVPVPINVMEGVVLTKHTDFPVDGWQSLKPFRVGIQRGIMFAERGTASIHGLKTHAVNSNEQLFGMLSKNRTDIIVVSRLNGLQTLKTLRIPDIHILEPPIETYFLYHYLHRKHRHLVPRLTAALKEMEAEGLILRTRGSIYFGVFRKIEDRKSRRRVAFQTM